MASDLLTWDEIQRRHDGEWVFLGDVEYVSDDPAETKIARARVLEHTPDHEELWRRAKAHTPSSFATLFIGEMAPTDLAFIL